MKTTKHKAAPTSNDAGIDYIHDPRFDNPESVHDILEAVSQLRPGRLGESVLKGDGYDLRHAPLLTREEEEVLFLRMNLLKCLAARRLNGAKAASKDHAAANLLAEAEHVRDQIVASNQRLVVSTAMKFKSYTIPIADLISEANIALLRAIDRFNVGLGFRFSTYATLAMRRHLQRLTMRDGKSPFAAGETLPDLLVDDEHPDWLDIHPSSVIREVLDGLSAREQRIVKYRFGLTSDGRSQTLHEIANRMSLSKERVRQILVAVLAKARNLYGARLGIA